MKVEIWSDIMCPFCYIGKRRFEAALRDFAHAGAVEVTWRSFELDPDMQTRPGQRIDELLAERKGVPLAEARRMNAHVAAMAAEAGLRFDFDRLVPVNTFLAHRFAHLATARGLSDAAAERLFAAFFTEGRNLAEPETLAELGAELGLPPEDVRVALAGEAYAQDVRIDEYQARQLGVRGVPFFVFNERYAVSGAQPAELFREVLEKAWAETAPVAASAGTEGPSCGPDGAC